jgi:hypothetical protein
MYECNICHKKATVDHVNPAKLNCECIDGKVVTNMDGHVFGRSHFGESVTNNNLSELSAMVLRNTLFSIASNEFFTNKKKEIEAKDVRVKDTETGREFSFTITGKEV